MRITQPAAVLLAVWLAGCVPVVTSPPPAAGMTTSRPAANPGRLVLATAGVFSALLVLLLVLEGTSLRD